jgi:class 3 adenylate cyclase
VRRQHGTWERFCGECGKDLSDSPKTFATHDPRSYTPKHLAEKILTSRSALEGERKQVTVLFADVKGSMDLAEQLDPEEWHKILDRFFQILTDGVHRFESTVNQYTGDGIMALFGAPITHEDHAQRACYAALHLCDELRPYADELRIARGLSFSVRMGCSTRVRSWSARSARTCAWTTRRRATRSGWRRAWSSSRRRAASI